MCVFRDACFVQKKEKKKCYYQFPGAHTDVSKCIVLSDQQSKHKIVKLLPNTTETISVV